MGLPTGHVCDIVIAVDERLPVRLHPHASYIRLLVLEISHLLRQASFIDCIGRDTFIVVHFSPTIDATSAAMEFIVDAINEKKRLLVYS